MAETARPWISHQRVRSASDAPLVVVIEDDITQRGLLSRVLEQDGYEVIAVGDGEIGFRAIVEHAPDLVLLDLNLPRMNGYEICRQLRLDPDDRDAACDRDHGAYRA